MTKVRNAAFTAFGVSTSAPQAIVGTFVIVVPPMVGVVKAGLVASATAPLPVVPFERLLAANCVQVGTASTEKPKGT